jgi:hypothetical protein
MSFYRTHTLTCTPSKLTHYGVVTHNEAEKITRAQRPMSGRMSRTMAWQRARRPQNRKDPNLAADRCAIPAAK